MDGLREHFIDCIYAEEKFSYMPSRVVYVAWFEFSVFTAELYDEFCQHGMGRYIYLTPVEAMRVMSAPEWTEARINQTWGRLCWRENRDPTASAELPLLFALDAELDIPDGFRYSLDDCIRRYREYLDSRVDSI